MVQIVHGGLYSANNNRDLPHVFFTFGLKGYPFMVVIENFP